ncbi:hypothetical protein DPMN_059427 [Dreissena polymorpha]|uniref:Uncharacterized protein n=1 Tax=Dreissena polymorpha TaxID=45954 RepID=A0A9D4C3Y8_DREPO|nr:hypothetical protein DPMN_059427 [Dreissena polymorpha]
MLPHFVEQTCIDSPSSQQQSDSEISCRQQSRQPSPWIASRKAWSSCNRPQTQFLACACFCNLTTTLNSHIASMLQRDQYK